jgi:hypothetical protein
VHVVVLLAVVPLLLVLGIVLVTPVVVRGLPVAVVLVAIGFAVREVSVWVVVLRELTPSPGPGCQAKTGEAASIMAANNPKSSINLLNSFSFPEASPYLFQRIVRIPPVHQGGTVGKPTNFHDINKYGTLQEIAHHANGLFLLHLCYFS